MSAMKPRTCRKMHMDCEMSQEEMNGFNAGANDTVDIGCTSGRW